MENMEKCPFSVAATGGVFPPGMDVSLDPPSNPLIAESGESTQSLTAFEAVSALSAPPHSTRDIDAVAAVGTSQAPLSAATFPDVAASSPSTVVPPGSPVSGSQAVFFAPTHPAAKSTSQCNVAPSSSPARIKAQPPTAEAPTVGTRVRIAGLVSALQHNGKVGRVCSIDAGTGRLVVLLDGGGTLRVKLCNLVTLSAPVPDPISDSFPHPASVPSTSSAHSSSKVADAIQDLPTAELQRSASMRDPEIDLLANLMAELQRSANMRNPEIDLLANLLAELQRSANMRNPEIDLLANLFRRIENSDPALLQLEISRQGTPDLKTLGALERALSLNTCITSLIINDMRAGFRVLPSIRHLTSLTKLDLRDSDIQSVGAAYLSSNVLSNFSSLTDLNLSNNKLNADDGAHVCAVADTSCKLRQLNLSLNPSQREPFSCLSVVRSLTWRMIYPQPSDDFVAKADFVVLSQYMRSKDKVSFVETYCANYHPYLPPFLQRCIESSDPAVQALYFRLKSNFQESACGILARLLSLNTCITCLDLMGTTLGPAGSSLLFRSLLNLTSMTFLNLWRSGLESSGASHLCRALMHITALTYLDLWGNQLNADDGARICGAAVASGTTVLKHLILSKNGFKPSCIVECREWEQLNLPKLPDEVLRQCGTNTTVYCNCAPLVFYILTHSVMDAGWNPFSTSPSMVGSSSLSSTSSVGTNSAVDTDQALPLQLLRRIERSDPQLIALDISDTLLSRQKCVAIDFSVLARALSFNTRITSLNLQYTRVGPYGSSLLFSALTHLTAMTYLNLGDTGLQDLGAFHLCRALCHLSSITYINLEFTDLRSSGASLLCKALVHLTSIAEIYMRGNNLFADDVALLCKAAAGTTTLRKLDLLGDGIKSSDVVRSRAWGQLEILKPSDNFIAIADFAALSQYINSRDKAEFCIKYHPELPLNLLQRIESNDPLLTKIEVKFDAIKFDAGKPSKNLGEYGCQILSRALSMNTRITSLDLFNTTVGPDGYKLLFPALTHLTTITYLNLGHSNLESAGASLLCNVLSHLTDITQLYLGNNNLTADDAARICGAANAACLTRLKVLNLDGNEMTPSSIVESLTWRQLNLPKPPDEIIRQCGNDNFVNCVPILSYLLSEHKVPSHSIRIFVIGESTVGKTSLVRALMSPTSKCEIIDLDNRTVGIDQYSMQLLPTYDEHSPSAAECVAYESRTIQPSKDPQAHYEDGQSHEACGRCMEAAVCYEHAVALGHVKAHAPLSLIYMSYQHQKSAIDALDRVGVAADRSKAVQIANEGARLGCLDCLGVLGFLESKSELLERSAQAGSCYGMFFVGMMNQNFELIKRASDLQFAPAQMFMGGFLHAGAIGMQDTEEGYRLIDCAAVRGYTFAQKMLQECGFYPAIDVQVWDLAGQDVYTLSHAVHFSHRCLYILVWKPGEPVATIMIRLSQWLESLCSHVPDAHILLVASHCKTDIGHEEFCALSGEVVTAVRAKIDELNDITRLEVDRLRTLFDNAELSKQRLRDEYMAHVTLSSEFSQKDAELVRRVGPTSGHAEEWAVRATATADHLPLSLRTRAAAVHDAFVQEKLLCERLQRLLGIRNGARPDNREAGKLTLHCKSVDSLHGHGITDLRNFLYHHCRSLPFMGELISSNWFAVAEVFKLFGDSVLSKTNAIALVRQNLLQKFTRLSHLNDDELWSVIEFWSLVGRIFVYDSHVLRDPSTLVALLKPLLHHAPLQMMRLPVYQNFLVETSLKSADQRSELESLLQLLTRTDEASLLLLDHFSAWKNLSADQRSSMLAFFERSQFLCRVDQRPHVRLISARARARPRLTEDVELVTAASVYHVIYLLPINHIGIMSRLQTTVSSVGLQYATLDCHSGLDSLLLRRSVGVNCSCVFSVEDFVVSVEQCARFKSLCSLLGDTFSCVLRVACTDFGMLKFATACVDEVLDSCSFGSRFQCWLTVLDASAIAGAVPWVAVNWLKFRDATSFTLNKHSLCYALQQNYHQEVITGQSLIDIFRPRSSIFVSHAWGDGTSVFIKRLKTHLEQQTLASVWVDQDGLNQHQERLIPAFRDALCQARIVVVVLTPSYLTRPNCLRELRWALDFERAGHVRVVILSMHPAVTFDGRLQLAQNGPLQGLLFSSKEKKVKRLCPEAIALVKRLNDVHMNTLPWHELQAWRSDDENCDWEEHRLYNDKGTVKQVHLAGCKDGLVEQMVLDVRSADSQGHPWLVCGSPRPVSECCPMDDSDALLADDVAVFDVPSNLMKVERYPENAAIETVLSRQLQPGDAAWEQDSSRVSCPGPNCGKRFNMLNRRHHCRFCGHVMCGGCAPVLERVGSHINVRCCDACFISCSGKRS